MFFATVYAFTAVEYDMALTMCVYSNRNAHYYYRDYDYFHKFIHTLSLSPFKSDSRSFRVLHLIKLLTKKRSWIEANDYLWLMPYFPKMIRKCDVIIAYIGIFNI